MTQEKRERPFIVRWRTAVLNSAEPASVKLTLLALAEFANKDGTNCLPGFSALARLTSQSERTCRRAVEMAGNRWFIRNAVKLAGKEWRAYRYTLLLAEGADTVSAASDQRSGQSDPKVRTLTPEGADTVSTVLEKAPREKHLGREAKAPAQTFSEWRKTAVCNGRLLPKDDPIFEFVDLAGIPDDFHTLAWQWFLQRYTDSDDRCTDWLERYRRCIREDWHRLWRMDKDTGEYVLTNAGEQMHCFVYGHPSDL